MLDVGDGREVSRKQLLRPQLSPLNVILTDADNGPLCEVRLRRPSRCWSCGPAVSFDLRS